MKYKFIYHNDEWEYIGNAIKRYLKFCKDINDFSISKFNGTDSIEEEVLLVPLFENEEPTGLRTTKELRKKKIYTFTTFFLTLSEDDIPQYFYPERKMSRYAIDVIKNPNFGSTDKAVFLGEIRYKKDNNEEYKYLNLVDLSKGVESLSAILKPFEPSFYYEKYYETFVNFYAPFDHIVENGKFNIEICELLEKAKNSSCSKEVVAIQEELDRKGGSKLKAQDVLGATNAVYNYLNDIEVMEVDGHSVNMELFRAPIPFSLQELIDAKEYIEGALNGKKIKLLLHDNRSDNKFIKENGDNGFTPQSLCARLKDFGLSSIFEIQMLGNVVYRKDNGNAEFYKILDYENDKRDPLAGFSDFKKDYEKFNFRWFKCKRDFNKKKGKCSEKETEYDNLPEYHKKFIDSCKTKGISINTCSDIVYHKIKSAHFILLDFFLNKENTYLAFDFIKDLSEIKSKAGDYSTTWYFITSAVYDSVMKYSQSGLLAEHYESAVVNAGDDPTNEKRQIIFVYKLLIFIQSRLRSFNSYKKAIYNLMLNDEKEQGKGVCCVTSGNRNKDFAECPEECGKNKCIEKIQTHIKRYLTEYDNIWSLFYGEKHERDYKDIAELLDDTIKKFLWLPEADWQRVQHQIDFINAKLESIGEKRKFSCNYINGEIKRRSEIY